jgi:hypothetical protein
MMWSNEQILHWRHIFEEYRDDSSQTALHCSIDQQRQHIQQEMLSFLHAFLAGELTLKEFNATFQHKTHGTWNIFHIRGRSGGLFLNKLVKHIPDEEHFAQLLRAVLRLPQDGAEGRWWMQAFMKFLEGVIASQQVTRLLLQPAHVPCFLSIWWHIQAPEQWPLPYPTVRSIMLSENDKNTALEVLYYPIERYFVFKDRFISLATELGLTIWETEHMLTWYVQKQSQIDKGDQGHVRHERDQKNTLALVEQVYSASAQVKAAQKSIIIAGEQPSSVEECSSGSCLPSLQWLLAKLGGKIGCQVWIRSSDHRKTWQHERLGALSLPALPALAEPSLQQMIEQIDVLWLLNDKIVAAYEIEQMHTDVSVGLLRLLDVNTLSPENMRLCMVIPQDRFEKVRSELQRPVFHKQHLQQRCQLISQEVLHQHAQHVLRWAGNLSVVDDLASLSVVEKKSEPSVDHHPANSETRKIGA